MSGHVGGTFLNDGVAALSDPELARVVFRVDRAAQLSLPWFFRTPGVDQTARIDAGAWPDPICAGEDAPCARRGRPD